MTEQELIERLERSAGPDRELANDVLFACGWTAHETSIGPSRHVVWESPDGHGFEDGDQPDPTASIDAALTLVPEGCRWTVFHPAYDQGIYQDGKAGADIHSPRSSGGGPRWKGFGATPAIALCIAALKARVHLRDASEQKVDSEADDPQRDLTQ